MEQRNHFAQQMNKICSATAEQIAQQLLSKRIIWNKICSANCYFCSFAQQNNKNDDLLSKCDFCSANSPYISFVILFICSANEQNNKMYPGCTCLFMFVHLLSK